MEKSKRPIPPFSPRKDADIDNAPKWSHFGVWFVLIFIAFCVLMSLSSCTKKVYLPVEHTVQRTDTLRLTQLRTDSVFIHDSISYIQKGDTILITKFRDRFKYVNLTDTIYQSKTDSVSVKEPYPVEVVKETSKPLAWWQKTLMWVGVACLLCAAVFLAILFRRH